MSDPLSIKSSEVDLSTNESDYFAFLVKRFGNLGAVLSGAGLVGPGVPVVASILGEVIALKIPEQKMDRVIRFLKILAERLNQLNDDVKERIKTDEFSDLLEDAIPQAARALSEERREYVADLLKNSLTENDLDHLGKKKLLSLLATVNDAEIILLKFYTLPDGQERDSMITRYRFIKSNLEKQSDKDLEGQESILFESYWGHLVMSSLIYGNQGADEKPTKLGLLLLKYVGLADASVCN
jgi:hypothetical protein